MIGRKSVSVIFDTNIWISYLIGKKLKSLSDLIANNTIKIITTPQLIDEIISVTQKPKLQKYFPKQKVDDLIEIIRIIAISHAIIPTHTLCRDPKDNFLLDLMDVSGVDYLITGDKDLLELNPFKRTKIITPKEFEIVLQN